MHSILLAAIIVVGSLGLIKRIPSNVATLTVVILTVLGVFTSPDLTSRLQFVGLALILPLLPYPLALLGSLTVRPLLHYLNFRVDAHRASFEFTPDRPRYDEVSARIAGRVEEALALGFRSHGRIAYEVGGNIAATEFLERDNGRIWVFVSTLVSLPHLPVALHCGVRLSPGEYLVVSNLSYVDPGAPARGYVEWRLPSVSRVEDLVRVTEFIAARSGPIIPMPLETDLQTRARVRTKMRYEAERADGYHRYDAAADVYRPTLKGAYRQFWVGLPPLNGIIDRRERERERRLLAEMSLTTTPRTDTGAEQPKPPAKVYLKAAAIVLLIIGLGVFGPELLAEMSGGRYQRPMPRVDVPSNLTVPDSFPAAVRLLEQMVGRPSHQLSGTVDDFPAPTRGVAISMHRDSARAFVAAAQDAFLAKRFYLFQTGERDSSAFDTDGLALWPGRDPYEIMKALDTNGANHRLLVDDVIAWFRNEEPNYSFRFEVIGFDYVGGKILGGLRDASGFAGRFFTFCPDLMQSGEVTVRILARDLEATREFYCWWD